MQYDIHQNNMKRLYKICGLYVACDFRYPAMTARSEKYLCDEEHTPDITVLHSEERLERMASENPHLSLADCEIILSTQAFYMQLLKFGGFMLHSSAVVLDGKAYLFSAPSGTGKSTHTSQWLKLFGDRAYILNDDKPGILVRDGAVFAAGSPWSGKSDLNRNAIVPLQGICVLSRAETNWIKPLPQMQAIYHLMNQTLRPTDPDQMNLLMTLLDSCLRAVPVWQMGCNISLDAAKCAYDTMCSNQRFECLRSCHFAEDKI